MAGSTKRQACVAFTVLLLMLSLIAYFLYWVNPVIKIVPVEQALQSVEAEKRAKELEAKLLKSTEANLLPNLIPQTNESPPFSNTLDIIAAAISRE